MRNAIDEPSADAPSELESQTRWSRVRGILQRPSVVSILDQAVVSATNLVAGVTLGRLCEAEGYGSYVLAMTVAIVGSGLLTELVSNPFTIYGQRRSGRTLATYAGSSVVFLLAASLLILGAIVGVIAAFGQLDKLLPILGIVCITAPLSMTREFIRQMSFARFEFRAALATDITVSLLHLSGLALAWSVGALSAATALVSMAVACGVAAAMWFRRARGGLCFSRKRLKPHAVRNWRFARWTLVAYAIGSTTPFVMPWVLAAFHGEVATGRLAAANSLIGLSFMFVTGVSNWLTAKAAREMQSRGVNALRRTLAETFGLLMLVLIPFVLFVWQFGEPLVVVVFGETFVGLGPVSFVIALGILANTGNVVAGNGLWALDRPQPGLWADVTTMLSTIIGALTLVPAHGVLGAAWATTIGQAAGAAVRGLLLRSVMLKKRSPGERYGQVELQGGLA